MTLPDADQRPVLVFDTMCLVNFAQADRLDVLAEIAVDWERWTTHVVLAEIRANHYGQSVLTYPAPDPSFPASHALTACCSGSRATFREQTRHFVDRPSRRLGPTPSCRRTRWPGAGSASRIGIRIVDS